MTSCEVRWVYSENYSVPAKRGTTERCPRAGR